MTAVVAWQKSSFSDGGDAPNCIELAATQGALWLRESDEPGTVVTTTATGLAALIRHLRMD
ncbi:DUF397 domain-containing protein [Streptomyces jeddahensis]|uniref:DUF397 domain-containing protein n=1 Tax=Streptomyces jeddahensis TaxID=1716141 RepID=A0A177HHH0_9ACTN|nr:DUF397 domain-containing protein [Streptomyces jeddahensis]OAH09628.1 hypothetical protein STSP_70840 [Streptomyces jeddahensis]